MASRTASASTRPSWLTERNVTLAPRVWRKRAVLPTQGCSTEVVTMWSLAPARIWSNHTPLRTVLLPSVAHPLTMMSSLSEALMPA